MGSSGGGDFIAIQQLYILGVLCGGDISVSLLTAPVAELDAAGGELCVLRVVELAIPFADWNCDGVELFYGVGGGFGRR